MIQLYHCSDARSFRCLWLLEELKLPYQLHVLEFPPRLKAPEFLQRHAIGTVPLLIDGDVTMFESAAILQYLVARHGPSELNVGVDEPGYADFLNWLHFSESSITTHLSVMMRYAYFEPKPRQLAQAVEDYGALVVERFQLLDQALAQHDYLSADRFTIADIGAGYALMLSRLLRLHEQWPPHLQPYWDRLRKRPAFVAAKERQKPAAAS